MALIAFLALGAVVLAVTGAEALYTDMGHFGRLPIRLAWYLLVLPALMLNYFGQGALLLTHPDSIVNPFFHLAPGWAGIPLVLLATTASVIASQAVISGAFSVTRQAMQLGYLPRMSIVHTSETEIGQIYIPVLNWTLGRLRDGARPGLPDVDQSRLRLRRGGDRDHGDRYRADSTGHDAAVAVAAALTVPLVAFFLIVDLAFFIANSTKILHGGWFPLTIGLVIFLLLTTWNRGRALLRAGFERNAIPEAEFFKKVLPEGRVAGAGNGDLPGERDRRRAAVAAQQPEAQPRPARTRHPAERHHRGGPLCVPRAPRRGAWTWAATATA